MTRGVWVFALACGGKSTEAETTDSSAPTDTTATTPTDTGWECNPWYPCQECGGESCLAEIGACAGDGACGASLNAWAECVLECGDPPVCAAMFEAAGGAPAASLLACVVGACAETCDL